MVNVAILGFGTIGSGVFTVLDQNREVVTKNVGEEVRVKYVLDLREFPGQPVEKVLVHDIKDIIEDPEVDIVVETMGGLHPAYDFTKAALEAGKNACTSNKAVVAEFGTELMQVAKANNCSYLFEASCGGGIPIIRNIHSCLTADVIDEVSGILNGTTNYILTQMTDNGLDYATALKQAQDLGYAERNPEADVEGHDAQRKISILSALAYGQFIDYTDVPTEGISKISAEDIEYAKAMGRKIKLLGYSQKTEAGVCAMVSPIMIKPAHPLYSVDDVFNAIFVHGNMLGDAMFYGSGAGSLQTASAVCADIVELAKNRHNGVMNIWKAEKTELLPMDHVENKFFVRVGGVPAEKQAEAEKAFGPVELVEVPEIAGEFAVITGMMTEAAFKAAAEKVQDVRSVIRVKD